MSTLEYLDGQGSAKSFGLVPWSTLNVWLSAVNGSTSSQPTVPSGVNRGTVIEELEVRRKEQDTLLVDGMFRMIHLDRGFGKDWREYENRAGFTHLEELLIYDWQKAFHKAG